LKDAEFDATVRRGFDKYMQMRPEVATFFGIHEYDHLLPQATLKAKRDEIQFFKDSLQEMEQFSAQELSFERVLDRDIMIRLLRLGLFRDENLRIWQKMAEAPDTIGGALFLLFTREFAPFEARLRSMAERIEKIPRFLEESKELVNEPVKLWNEVALESSERLPGFLQLILYSAGSVVKDPSFLEKLKLSAEKATAALGAYNSWLRNDIVPKGSSQYWIGGESFRQLIGLRDLGLTPNEILSLGEKYLVQTKREREEYAAKVLPGEPVEKALEFVKSKHPKDFQEALSLYRDSMNKAKEFIRTQDLATLPPNERLLVIETPAFLRHVIPFAAYLAPAKFDKERLGIYVVTPPEKPELIKNHNYADISNVSVHEAYPGHHMQLSWATENPSLPRILSEATELVEGWAFYCEQMMKEQGYDETAENRLVQTNDLVWRAVRIIVDVRLHRGEMSFEEAVEFLVRETSMPRESAVAEVKRYTFTPGQPLSYLLGKHLILRLREDVQKRMGENFSLKFFHDALLQSGNLPISFLERVFEHKLSA
jgi:uncharacterized protein (DUF885 family)